MSSEWRYAGVQNSVGNFSLSGVNLMKEKWTRLPVGPVLVRDPLYGEEKVLNVYEVTTPKTRIRFAAGEFSNGVLAFYVPVEAPDKRPV